MNQIRPSFVWNIMIVSFLLFQGCVTVKMPLASQKDGASLGINIYADSYTAPWLVESIDLKQVFFIKLADKEQPLTQKIIYKSNFYFAPFASGFQVGGIDIFLLGIEPGFYAAVGGIGSGHSSHKSFLIYFPEQMIKETITEVKSNTMVYMGKFVLSKVNFWERMSNSDKIQNFYFSNQLFVEAPHVHSPTMKSFEKSTDKEIDFLEEHKETFKSSDWSNHISRRLEMLHK